MTLEELRAKYSKKDLEKMNSDQIVALVKELSMNGELPDELLDKACGGKMTAAEFISSLAALYGVQV